MSYLPSAFSVSSSDSSFNNNRTTDFEAIAGGHRSLFAVAVVINPNGEVLMLRRGATAPKPIRPDQAPSHPVGHLLAPPRHWHQQTRQGQAHQAVG